MKVVAKFKCETVTPNPVGDEAGYFIRLYPVTEGSAENELFYKMTPGGEINLATVNPAAAAVFQVGAEYFVTFDQDNESWPTVDVSAEPAAAPETPPASPIPGQE